MDDSECRPVLFVLSQILCWDSVLLLEENARGKKFALWLCSSSFFCNISFEIISHLCQEDHQYLVALNQFSISLFFVLFQFFHRLLDCKF